jgi:outer membrane protein assembly factor BamB
MKSTCLVILLIAAGATTVRGADWPMYRADCGRSGYSPDKLADKLVKAWKYVPQHAPRPAWPKRPLHHVPVDYAFQGVVADGILYFGSSADDTLYALDASTGKQLWQFTSDGPIRFAPAVSGGKVYFVSDDGYLYCLDAKSGTLAWKFLGAPDTSKSLGNDRMISRYPARGAPTVQNGIVYFAAGIWPSEGCYIYAIDCKTGNEVWKLVSTGEHNFAAQGYLAVSGNVLALPSGRNKPVVVSLDKEKKTIDEFTINGRGNPIVFDGMVSCNSFPFDVNTASIIVQEKARLTSEPLAVSPDYIMMLWRGRLKFIKRSSEKQYKERTKVDRRGKNPTVVKARMLTFIPEKDQRVSFKHTDGIACANKFVLSNTNSVCIIDLAEGNKKQQLTFDSNARGLAIADQRLYVFTEDGAIHCYAADATSATIGPSTPIAGTPDKAAQSAADEIIKKTGLKRGFCVDAQCGKGDLTIALLQKTDLRIYAFDEDPNNVKIARDRLLKAGLYGVRATVHLGKQQDHALDKYAELVVSGRAVSSGATATDALTGYLCPFRGQLLLGKLGNMKYVKAGPLEGSGNWTHMYADSGHTLCSNDSALKGKLRMRWYRDVIIPVPSRHGRAQAPLLVDGIMVIPGLNAITAVNAYNGHTMWELPINGFMDAFNAGYIPGGGMVGGVICYGDGLVFARVETECYVIDIETGKLLRKYKAPLGKDRSPAPWAYLAYNNGVLYGSLGDNSHRIAGFKEELKVNRLISESTSVFAFDVKTHKMLWQHNAKNSISHNAIAVGAEAIYLIDRKAHTHDSTKQIGKAISEYMKTHKVDKAKAKTAISSRGPGRLIALDARGGKAKWQQDDVFANCLTLVDKDNRLMLGNQFDYSEKRAGGTYDTKTGKKLSRSGQNRSIVNEVMNTGNEIKKAYEGRGGKSCGIATASKYIRVYREGYLGYVDYSTPQPTQYLYKGVRFGCWVTAVPANGILAQAASGYGCRCKFTVNQATFAMESVRGLGK